MSYQAELHLVNSTQGNPNRQHPMKTNRKPIMTFSNLIVCAQMDPSSGNVVYSINTVVTKYTNTQNKY